MPNWAKNINKKCGDQIGGETATAGAFLHPAGTVAKTAALGALGGIAGVTVGEKLAKRRRAENEGEEESGLASSFPSQNVVLGLTETRLVVFSHSTLSGKPKELLAEYRLHDVAAIDMHQKKALHKKTRIFFADGSAVDLDAPKASGIDDFCVALNNALP
ncbi:MAG: hypothetical protein GY724_24475 [Actinomycetia bacterium]|nr:hypothetical protein [Actinomycetes bacterium]